MTIRLSYPSYVRHGNQTEKKREGGEGRIAPFFPSSFHKKGKSASLSLLAVTVLTPPGAREMKGSSTRSSSHRKGARSTTLSTLSVCHVENHRLSEGGEGRKERKEKQQQLLLLK